MKKKPVTDLASDLKKLAVRVRKGWKKLYPVTEQELQKFKNALSAAKYYETPKAVRDKQNQDRESTQKRLDAVAAARRKAAARKRASAKRNKPKS